MEVQSSLHNQLEYLDWVHLGYQHQRNVLLALLVKSVTVLYAPLYSTLPSDYLVTRL